MKIDMDTYRTKDLPIAAFLYASGKKLFESHRIDGRIWFVFDEKDTCEEMVNSYWRKEASVNAKEFADAIRTLKDLIFNK